MPVYKYECSKCGLKLELIVPLSERDNLEKIKKEYCTDNCSHCNNESCGDKCGLKRVQTSGSFKI